MNLLQSDNQWSQSIDPKRTMTKAEFFSSYASHYAVLIYVAIVLATGALSLYLMQSWWQLLGSFALVALVYPAVEFVLHRFVLHSRTLYRMPWTAGLWRRIHYDHHMNPNDLSVLFGAPYTTIPAVLAPTLPLGYLAFGWPGAAATVCGGFIALLIYEFFHCAAHLPVKFESRTHAAHAPPPRPAPLPFGNRQLRNRHGRARPGARDRIRGRDRHGAEPHGAQSWLHQRRGEEVSLGRAA